VCREQKTAEAGCPQEDTVEPEDSVGVRSPAEPDNGEGTGALHESILMWENMERACKRVVKNKGASGVDGMKWTELEQYVEEKGQALIDSIRDGSYKPKPVLRCEIEKPDGGTRTLGIPTCIDRMVQQMATQKLSEVFEPTFSNSSYGFRPGRSAQQAIMKARELYDAGYKQVVDIDLAKYFDTVNHGMLIEMIREQVQDEQVIRLIKLFLKSGIMSSGLVSPTVEGVPQGGPLSPLLSNVYLTRFDKLLEARGLQFVRYADDCNIYVKSRRAALRVMEHCKSYLEGKLKLKVNEEKSAVGSPMRLKFLGFSLSQSRGTGIRPHKKAITRLMKRIRELTDRNQGHKTYQTIFAELKEYLVGWLGYYAIADMQSLMIRTDGWIRRRIRQIFWKRWKRIRTRYKSLRKLGVCQEQACQWANTRKGYWRIAGSSVLSTTLTKERLEKNGLVNLSEIYEAKHRKFVEPPDTERYVRVV